MPRSCKAGFIAKSLLSAAVSAADINVISTQATQEAYLELAAQFEKASGHKVKTVFNGTLNVQKRLADGEPYDLIIMAGPARRSQGRAQARHRLRRRIEEDTARGEVHRLFHRPERPLHAQGFQQISEKHGLEPA